MPIYILVKKEHDMDNFSVNKYRYFKEHNIKADVKKGDILEPQQIKAHDILLGKSKDKLINKMSDIFPPPEEMDK